MVAQPKADDLIPKTVDDALKKGAMFVEMKRQKGVEALKITINESLKKRKQENVSSGSSSGISSGISQESVGAPSSGGEGGGDHGVSTVDVQNSDMDASSTDGGPILKRARPDSVDDEGNSSLQNAQDTCSSLTSSSAPSVEDDAQEKASSISVALSPTARTEDAGGRRDEVESSDSNVEAMDVE
mmetsp:Transcript_23054/g.39000  ORF Transcript_23054/g.39000 Transcript_23054/m.39000 type:complete len:185 (-) Transcript_23054:140-694(-)